MLSNEELEMVDGGGKKAVILTCAIGGACAGAITGALGGAAVGSAVPALEQDSALQLAPLLELQQDL